MTREELIKNLKYTMQKHKNYKMYTFGTDISAMCRDILDYLEQEPCEDCISRQFMYEIGATCIATRDENGKLIALGAIEELPSVNPKEPKWIPVSERLPKEDEVVIGLDCSDDICNAELYDDCGRLKWYSQGVYDVPIVAWLPLPKPYKESEVEE